MDDTGWEQMAEWWDNKLGDDGDLWHRALIDPPVFKLVGAVTGQRVLDLACGNGYISRRLARAGAQVVGIDSTAAIVGRARAREAREPLGIAYHVCDAAQLPMLEDSTFDLVVCNMALMDIADAASAIREVGRVLAPQGRFVASIAHPCFDKMESSGWLIEHFYPTTTIWRKMSRYRDLAVEHIPWPKAGDQPIITLSYHRPLSWYFQALRAAGLVVAALEEPEPTEEFLASDPQQGAWIAEIPLHCVFEAWKLARTAAQ
jgi:ubiquinone/menaquinone biosynthesis C-methylase UbiE